MPVIEDHVVVQVDRIGVAVGEGQRRHLGEQVEAGVHHADRAVGRVVEAVANRAARNDRLLEIVDLPARPIAVVVLQAAIARDDVGVGRGKPLRVERRQVQVAGLGVAVGAHRVRRMVDGARTQRVGGDCAADVVGDGDRRIRTRIQRCERDRDVLIRSNRAACCGDADVAAGARKAQLRAAALQVRLQREELVRRVVGDQPGAADADRVDRAQEIGDCAVDLSRPRRRVTAAAAAQHRGSDPRCESDEELMRHFYSTACGFTPTPAGLFSLRAE